MSTRWQFECFMAVARTSNFSEAAKELFITQPTLSHHIALLEKEMGFRLFDRTSKKVALTESGKEFYILCRHFYESLNNIRRKASAKPVAFSEITIGFLDRWDLSSFLPTVIKDVKQVYPDLEINIRSYGYSDLIVAFENKEIDILILMEAMLDMIGPEGCHEYLCDISNILLYSPNNRIAEITDPKVSDFADEDFFICSTSLPSLPEAIKELGMRYNFIPKIKVLPTISSCLDAVVNGLGILFVDSWCKERERMLYKELDTKHAVYLGYSEDKDPEFLEFIASSIRNVVRDQA